MLNDKQLKQISNILDLEKINVVQKINIVIWPKKEDDNFKKNLEMIKKQLKSNSVFIDITIGKETEIEYTKLLEYNKES